MREMRCPSPISKCLTNSAKTDQILGEFMPLENPVFQLRASNYPVHHTWGSSSKEEKQRSKAFLFLKGKIRNIRNVEVEGPVGSIYWNGKVIRLVYLKPQRCLPNFRCFSKNMLSSHSSVSTLTPNSRVLDTTGKNARYPENKNKNP